MVIEVKEKGRWKVLVMDQIEVQVKGQLKAQVRSKCSGTVPVNWNFQSVYKGKGLAEVSKAQLN